MVGIPVTIEYDDEWNGLTKNLVCRCGKWGHDQGETRTILNVGETATVAHEVMKADTYLYLGIEGYSTKGDLVMPTTWAKCGRIQQGANAGADSSTNPKLSVWAQLQTEIQHIKEDAVTKEQISAVVAAYLEENPIETPDSSSHVKLPVDENGRPVYGTIDWYAVSDGKGGINWVESAHNTGNGESDGDSGTTTHGIVWDLVNVTSSNPVASINDGEALTAVLTPASGYTLGDVNVTMGGKVLTGVWNADTATITIESVTGDVTITCSATYTVDTSPAIAVYDKGLNISGGQNAITGLCITEIYHYEQDIDGLKALDSYDAKNDYMTVENVFPAMTLYAPRTNFDTLYPGTVGVGNANKVCFYTEGDTFAFYRSSGGAYGKRLDSSLMDITGVAFTLYVPDIDDSYAYWKVDDKYVYPVGVRGGDIIFAGKNTEYYGMANIDGTMPGGGSVEMGLSLDDDIARNYAVATASVLGEDTETDTNGAYGISSDLAAVIDKVRTAWMIEYGGDPRKIPLIITTDQHGRTNAGIFNMLGKTLSLHDVSKICNLGDTCAVEWVDADADHPLLSCSALENWCESIKAIPFSKRLDVYGNHDAWYYDGYSVEGNTVGTRYPATMHHLDQYFRNIYARRNNNHGWGAIRDDYFNVKYLIVTGFEFKNGTSASRISTAQMKNIIAELSMDDGYDIVIMSHMPLHYQVSSATYPTGMNPEDTTTTGITRFSGVDTDTLFNARKNKTSGTITDSDGVEHSFDFSSCTTEILCGLNGHMHLDAYNHIGGYGLANMTFDWFDGNTVHFVLIDRKNRQINVWKMEGTALSYTNYQVPMDKAAE
jgi:hypothetical protein